jgi:hypothetical protein
MLTLLGARAIASWPATRAGRWALGGVAAVTLIAGNADQQLNGANPRIYDFRGALSWISDRYGSRDVVLYQPSTLNNVIDYYAPGVDRRPLEGGVPAAPGTAAARRAARAEAAPGEAAGEAVVSGHVFVLESFMDNRENVRITQDALHKLRRHREQVGTLRVPQVKVWEFR